MRYLYACAHEQFPPDDLLRQAVAAEQAGFDGIACSDHPALMNVSGADPHAAVDFYRDSLLPKLR